MSGRIVPFYVFCDISYSMADHLDILNQRLRELHQEIGSGATTNGTVRICLITFAETPDVVFALGQHGPLPDLHCTTGGAETRFTEVFELARDTIEKDLTALVDDLYEVLRPVVFFLSDGQPTDHLTWPAAHRRLVEPTWPNRPTVIAFGIGDADTTTIARIGTYRAFMSKAGTTPAAALREFGKTVTRSVVGARSAVSAGRTVVPCLPDHAVFTPPGFGGFAATTGHRRPFQEQGHER